VRAAAVAVGRWRRKTVPANQPRLLAFFGADRDLLAITKGDAADFLGWMKTRGLAEATQTRTFRHAEQFCRYAVDHVLLTRNPFTGMKLDDMSNPERAFFVTLEMATVVLDACPDVEWRLIFALCRYGGLRCPSEVFSLWWVDVDWKRSRFLVHSPKTEHHKGKATRWVPIFPELRTILDEAWDQAEEGAVYVISHRRTSCTRIGRELAEIIKRAGLEPWERLFSNLRASRETELMAQYPVHVVCAWLGNTPAIAGKHYLQVREEDFAAAAENRCTLSVQEGIVTSCKTQNGSRESAEDTAENRMLRNVSATFEIDTASGEEPDAV
jgi:integrase